MSDSKHGREPWYADIGPLKLRDKFIPNDLEPWEIALAMEMAFARGMSHGLQAARIKPGALEESQRRVMEYRCRIAEARSRRGYLDRVRGYLLDRIIAVSKSDGGSSGG